MTTRARKYQNFWEGVGKGFPDLGGAASTRYYAQNEERLLTEHFPALEGLTILKTDLWDEAKNTRILLWAAQQGARAFGIDISEPTVRQARAAFEGQPNARPLQGVAGDVRDIPFKDDSFDAVYSMGTIEHFDATERAVAEMARVLKPGGAPSSVCRIATTRFCGRRWPRSCSGWGFMPMVTKNPIRGASSGPCSNARVSPSSPRPQSSSSPGG
ncbi:MAG: class I SAM-dependent methyltransferase [Acidobacteria bacterium]|nr:class I SAM-dependent methyltransferase [Acidobacteriota bacterium]